MTLRFSPGGCLSVHLVRSKIPILRLVPRQFLVSALDIADHATVDEVKEEEGLGRGRLVKLLEVSSHQLNVQDDAKGVLGSAYADVDAIPVGEETQGGGLEPSAMTRRRGLSRWIEHCYSRSRL